MVDVSRNVVGVLLVLVIVLSGFSTYLVLNTERDTISSSSGNSGNVGVRIGPANQAAVGLTIQTQDQNTNSGDVNNG